MSLEADKREIMAALARRRGAAVGLKDPEAAWADISKAVASAREALDRFEQRARRDPSGSSRQDQIEKLAASLAAARVMLTKVKDDPYLVEPIAWATGVESADERWLDVDWDGVEEELSLAAKYLGRLQDWAERGRDEAASAVVKHRIPSPQARALDSLAYSLALVFADQTGNLPGVSKSDIATPFEEFLTAVAVSAGFMGDDAEGSRSPVKQAIRRLDAKRNQEFHIDRLEPKPDGQSSVAEVFKAYLDQLGE